MRAQQLLALAGLILAGNVAIAAKVEQDDVPNRCWDACGPVVGVSRRCDNQHDNDRAELQCICDWEAAKTQIPLCAACITQYGHRDDDHDDDDHDDDDDNGEKYLIPCLFSNGSILMPILQKPLTSSAPADSPRLPTTLLLLLL